jgi:hypothetical protein
MEQIPLEKLTVRSASQEIPCILCNPKVHYRVHTSPPPVTILSYMNPIHTLTPYRNIHFNIVLPSTPKSYDWSLPFRLSNQNFVCIYDLPIVLHALPISSSLIFIIPVIFLEEYILWSSSLRIFLYPPVTLSLLVQNILLSVLYTYTVKRC